MATSDSYISELTKKVSTDISGEYSFVIQEPQGQANTTYRIELDDLVSWIVTNTNYTEVYDLPIKEDTDTGDTSITVVYQEEDGSPPDFAADSPYEKSRTEVIRVTAVNKFVGIDTQYPFAKLDVYSSNGTYGDIMITPTSGERMGFHGVPRNEESSPIVDAQLQFGRKIAGEDSSFVPLASLEESGTFNCLYSLNVVGGSTLGPSSPSIELIELTGTTGTIDLESSPAIIESKVEHGIFDISNIIGVACTVYSSGDSGGLSKIILPKDLTNPSSYYEIDIDETYCTITVIGDSEMAEVYGTLSYVQDCPFTFLLTLRRD